MPPFRRMAMAKSLFTDPACTSLNWFQSTRRFEIPSSATRAGSPSRALSTSSTESMFVSFYSVFGSLGHQSRRSCWPCSTPAARGWRVSAGRPYCRIWTCHGLALCDCLDHLPRQGCRLRSYRAYYRMAAKVMGLGWRTCRLISCDDYAPGIDKVTIRDLI